MKILLTGSTGYIGRRLLPVLLDKGHHVVCLVRNKEKFDWKAFSEDAAERVSVIEGDLGKVESLTAVPLHIDVAYFLVHSMTTVGGDFADAELTVAKNFAKFIDTTSARQIIYLSGIANDENLSNHLSSRKSVERVLSDARASLTVFRAAIIIGSGSASFEIIRDLVEKLPIMIAPKWLSTKCQPIAIRNVLQYLEGALLREETFDKTFDIGGTDVLTYKQMLYTYAEVRKLKRTIISVPVLTPHLSSLWLVFITSTSYTLSRHLVNSMKNEVVVKNNDIRNILTPHLFSYREALQLAFEKISHKNILSSWRDSSVASRRYNLNNTVVPTEGVFIDRRELPFTRSKDEVVNNLWAIGGERGWYYATWLWRLRGFIDTMFGGVGLRRGRRSALELRTGDALDFWRVILADKAKGRLILYAEMKLPGEAWLEYNVIDDGNTTKLTQAATFRPVGLLGRFYWYLVLPFHGILFPRLIKSITQV